MTLFGLSVRNLAHNRLRTLLTVGAVTTALFTFTILRVIVAAWVAGSASASQTRLVTKHKLTSTMPLPIRYASTVAGVPHVTAVCVRRFFGGTAAPEIDPVPSTAVSPEGFLRVYADDLVLSADQRDAFVRERQGAIIGKTLADERHWKLGERVTLEGGVVPAAPEPRTFTIVGIFASRTAAFNDGWFYFHYDYLNDTLPPALRDVVSSVVSKVDSVSNAPATALSIDRLFDSADLQTRTQDERAAMLNADAAVGSVLRALDFISFILVIIVGLIIGNTISMSVRERTREFGVLGAIGFSPRAIGSYVVVESMILSFLGALLGLILAATLNAVGLGAFIEDAVGPVTGNGRTLLSIAGQSLGVAALVGALAAAAPAVGALRLRPIDALRRVA